MEHKRCGSVLKWLVCVRNLSALLGIAGPTHARRDDTSSWRRKRGLDQSPAEAHKWLCRRQKSACCTCGDLISKLELHYVEISHTKTS